MPIHNIIPNIIIKASLWSTTADQGISSLFL